MSTSVSRLLCAALIGHWLLHSAAQTDAPNVTYAGYVSTNRSDDSQLYYAYYEAQADVNLQAPPPVVLWLQVCPYMHMLGLHGTCSAKLHDINDNARHDAFEDLGAAGWPWVC